MSHLLATPQGLTLAGIILAKRNSDGSFAIAGREKYIHAQLQAAFGKKISPQAMRYIQRGCELLAKASDQELENAAYQRRDGSDGSVTRGYVDFGNFNFGMVAAAAGYTYDEAIMAAAAENLTGSGRKNGPWGSNPDNYFILQGYNAYKNGRIK